MSCQLNVFDLLEQVGECVVAFSVGLGRGVGSIQMNGVSFFILQVQGVGSKGWRDVTTFFSGKPDDNSERPAEGDSYQNSGGEGYQNNAIDQSFWETFGNSDPPKAHKSPSSESWTYVDNSTEKKSSDSWDVWGSGTVSNKNSNSDSWENWETNWENTGGESKTRKPPKATKNAWDDFQDSVNPALHSWEREAVLADGGEEVLHTPGVSWLTFLICLCFPFILLPSTPVQGKKKQHLNLFLPKVGSPFFKDSGNCILLALLELATATLLTRMLAERNQCKDTSMAQPCMCRLIGVHPVLI